MLTDTAAVSVTVTCLSDDAPEVDAGPDQTVDEGDVVAFSGTFTDTNGMDPHTLLWDFDDGETLTGTLTPTHTYADNGSYTVTLTVTDDHDRVGWDTLAVTVTNVAPAVDAGPDQVVGEGSAVAFSGTFTDAGTADTHTVLWDFGDGETLTGTLTPTHTYTRTGAYTVTLTVTDDDGGVGSDALLVTVEAGAGPAAVDAGPDQVTDEGSEVAFSGTFTGTGGTEMHTVPVGLR